MKSSFNQLGKNSVIYGLGSSLNRFVSFLLLPLFTRYLTPHDYGVMSILGLVTLVMAPVFSLGLTAATAPYYFDTKIENVKAKTIWTAVVMIGINTIILGLLSFSLSNEISVIAFKTKIYQGLVVLTIGSISINCITNLFNQYLQFEQRAKQFVMISTVSLIVTSALNIIAVVVLGWGIKGLLQTQLIGQILSLCLFTVSVARNLKFTFSKDLAKRMLRIGIPLVPSFAFFFVLQDANRYLLEHWKGLVAVGIYSIGYNFGMVIRTAINAFEQSWLPFFMQYKEKQEEARIFFGKLSTYYVLGFGALSLMFYIFAKPAVMLMTQPAFYDGYKIVGLSSTAAFLSGIFILLVPGFYFTKQVQYVTLVQAIAAACALLFNYLLIPKMGMFGAGLALTLGMFSLVCVTYFWSLFRKGYLKVVYEWDRLLIFFSFYILTCSAMLIDRKFAITGEIILSIIAFTALILCMFFIMNRQEKRAVSTRIRLVFNMVGIAR